MLVKISKELSWPHLLLIGLIVSVEDEFEATRRLVEAESVHVGLVAGEALLHVYRRELGGERFEAEQHPVQQLGLLLFRHACMLPPSKQ